MILVNNPGTWRAVYRPLQHAHWNGCTPPDLIFPFFLFIVGVAITLSIGSRAWNGEGRRQLLVKIVRRTLIIFALGIFLNGFPQFDWSEVRIPGVLQRIAACYFFACLIVITMGVRAQAATTVALLVGYWAVMKLVPIPGHPAGLLRPGHNLAAYIDSTVLHGHLLHHHWDPEGILSTVPAIATTLTGVLTGHWMCAARSPLARLWGLFIAGNVCLVLGVVMNYWFPINKSLWTSSYVVFTTGMALNFFGVCYWLVDIRQWRCWATPFVIYGTNAILAYMLSTLTAKALLLWRVTESDGSKVVLQRYVFEHAFLRLASPMNASLLYAIAYVLCWLGITAILYHKKIFIKI